MKWSAVDAEGGHHGAQFVHVTFRLSLGSLPHLYCSAYLSSEHADCWLIVGRRSSSNEFCHSSCSVNMVSSVKNFTSCRRQAVGCVRTSVAARLHEITPRVLSSTTAPSFNLQDTSRASLSALTHYK